jgi:hypothetical protein
MIKSRRSMLAALAFAALLPPTVQAQSAANEVVLYKNASCGCCGKWAEHMQRNGFRVVAHDLDNLASIRGKYRVPAALGSCHTAIVGGYAIEGHVPAALVRRLLEKKPAGVIGLAVPGMPQGSPGMESPTPQRYDILAFDAKGGTRIYDTR